MAHNPCCCCPTIGFDEDAWSKVTTCCAGMSPIINLKNDVSKLSQCAVVFAGGNNICWDPIRFASADWPAVRSYIEGGGRLFLNLENSACVVTTNISAFLSAIGSGMSYGGEDNLIAATLTPGAANIAQPPNNTFTCDRYAKINGGTSVWTDSGKVVVAVEKLVNGYFFLTGDSNLNGCDFWKRLWDYADGDII